MLRVTSSWTPENICQLAVVALGPNMIAACGIDELSRNADAPACPADTALQDVFDTQLAGDGCDFDGLALVGER